MESKLGALIPLTQKNAKRKKRREASQGPKPPDGQISPLIKGDSSKKVASQGTLKSVVDEQSSGRELYSQVLGRRQRKVAKKRQESTPANVKPSGSELRSAPVKFGPSKSGTQKGKSKTGVKTIAAPPTGKGRRVRVRPLGCRHSFLFTREIC